MLMAEKCENVQNPLYTLAIRQEYHREEGTQNHLAALPSHLANSRSWIMRRRSHHKGSRSTCTGGVASRFRQRMAAYQV